MDPERWQQLKEIFEAALDVDASRRAAFLEKACRTDPSMRREVEALIKSQGGDSFLEKPAYKEVPELFDSGLDEALVGNRLGPYAITGKLGRGGMGIVYLAKDTRLDRPVAIKMLAPKYTDDPQQRERLKREARAAARLSHPGIATVYSFEELEDKLYIVSEYVKGNTLLQVMAEGPLRMPVVMDIAIQIARALASAHENGIVHRDLKPENVARTDSGVIKILDFGLARIEPTVDTTTNARLTRSGMFLGTPAYSSPEQLRGGAVDRRTDIFSYGVLLYELAAGKHPFGNADSMAIIGRILESEATDITRINPSIPKELDRIIQRCLKKDPEERYSSTRDLVFDLEQLSESMRREALGPAPADETPKKRALWWWQLHQAVAGFGYYGMLYPMWRVKQWLGGVEGSMFFFPIVAAVMVAANLRLHLWFTSYGYPSELAEQRRLVWKWIRGADILFVLTLAICAIRIHTIHAIIATLLMAVAVGSLVAFALIEPTSARAALDKKE